MVCNRFLLVLLAASAVAFGPGPRSAPRTSLARRTRPLTPRRPLPHAPKSKEKDGEDDDEAAASAADPISAVTSAITAVLFAAVGLGLLLNINGYGYLWGPDGLEFGTLAELRMSYALEHRLPPRN